MFAVAIWDDRVERLLLARDRIGKKPLYWGRVNSGLTFASEAKALLRVVPNRAVDPVATSMYFVSDSVPTPLSIWSGICKLEPGTFLSWTRDEGFSAEPFWNPQIGKVEPTDFWSAVDSLEECLERSTAERMMADVPIGVFLSSGVDSLTVAAVARRMSGRPLQTFTLAFEDSSYDESLAASVFAHEQGFAHEQVPIADRDLVSMFDTAVEIFDEPLNDPASLVMLRLAEAASASVKVVLTGDGGDELFLGYPHVRAHALIEGLPRRIQSTLRHLRSPLSNIPTSDRYMSFGFKAQRLARGLGETDLAVRDLSWRGTFTPKAAYSLLDRDFSFGISPDEMVEPLRANSHDLNKYASVLDEWSWMYLRGYLLDTVLVKVDRATMAFGVEARSPLLDSQLVETVLSMPIGLRRKGLGKKRLLREVLRRQAPRSLPAKRKHGMGVPTSRLLRGPLRDRLHDYACAEFLARQGIFNPSAVTKMLLEFEKWQADLRKEVWGFLVFQAWYERWVDQPPLRLGTE